MRGESEHEREQRINDLWEILDDRRRGQVDLKDFKRGLKKMDHPLKNADSLLKDIIEAVDTSGDGRIQFNEFRDFVERAERELWQLFETVDRDHDGHVDKEELQSAFARAGLTVRKSKLDQFFSEMDTNNDGVISFEEWRDFLLFLPANPTHLSNMRAILSYYSATGNLNPEGDVHINEPLQGLGRESHIDNVFRCHPDGPVVPSGDAELEWLPVPWNVSLWLYFRYLEHVLTESTPHLGYFLAGGMAGVVSRTSTAPLDRLRVYLIAQTKPQSVAASVKSGAVVEVAGWRAWPLVHALKDLWRAGGIRSLFAGNGLNVAKVMPESAIKFGAYEASRRMFAGLEGHHDPKQLLPVSQFLAGGIGGMVSQCFVYPLDTLKFRMQCETVEGGLRGNRLIIATARKMWSTHGVFAYYRGLQLGLIGMFPYAAIDLMTFEYLKSTLISRKAHLLRCHEEDAPLSNFTTGAIGAFSGALSASMVYPLNVLRTRLQAQGTTQHKATYTGVVDVARKTFESEGVRGLYRGLTPNLLKVVPSVSISYIVYENSKRLLGLS
uniref:Mitochondrial thiamine pyrophosphate carrier 1 n=1 Tax=Coccidioides posadasii RMSCC 3488 TaxID=454284 RepID=A0A0J6F074_COCPO|nr:Sal1p [Coccidioides posadasii RMSCC 3488]